MRPLRLLPALLVVALLLMGGAACARHDERSVTVDGQRRTFRLHLPPDLPAAPVPLVVMLHGGFGSGKQAESDYGWDELADREGFAVAYPDGSGRAWNVGGGCCGAAGADDVGFIRALIPAVGAAHPVDPARIYATGISNGGMLTYRLACDTDLFAAIGPDAATLLGDCPSPPPVSILHLHGTADTRVRLTGGPGEGAARIDGPPVPAVIAQWRATDGCAPATTTATAPVTTSTAECPNGRTVTLITITGAGHQWPGARPKPVVQHLTDTDEPSTALNATRTLWTFFKTHPKP